MRHVGPVFSRGKRFHVQPVMQFPQAISPLRDANKHGWRDRAESLHLAQRYLEGIDLAANFFNSFAGGKLAALQVAGWQNTDMGFKVKPLRVKLAAQSLDKFPG